MELIPSHRTERLPSASSQSRISVVLVTIVVLIVSVGLSLIVFIVTTVAIIVINVLIADVIIAFSSLSEYQHRYQRYNFLQQHLSQPRCLSSNVLVCIPLFERGLFYLLHLLM